MCTTCGVLFLFQTDAHIYHKYANMCYPTPRDCTALKKAYRYFEMKCRYNTIFCAILGLYIDIKQTRKEATCAIVLLTVKPDSTVEVKDPLGQVLMVLDQEGKNPEDSAKLAAKKDTWHFGGGQIVQLNIF